MIGGKDIFIEMAGGPWGLDCAVRTIRLFWPKAVFENGVTAELTDRYDRVAFVDAKEILIYRDFASFKEWERLGADPSLDGTMIHLLASANDLTLVVDERPNLEVQKIIASVCHALRMNSFGAVRFQEAA